MIAINSYCLNPKLIVSELAGSGFVVYVPPDPTPYRLTNELWLALQSWVNETKTAVEWKNYLINQCSNDNKTHFFQDLLDKKIILSVHNVDQASLDSIEDLSSQKILEPQSRIDRHANDDVGETASINLIQINPPWPDNLRHFLLSVFWLQISFLAPILLIVLSYLIYLVFAPASGGLIFYDSVLITDNEFDVLYRVLIGLLSVNFLSTSTTWLAQSLTRTGDGWIVLRFLFGFIPRLGVNPYSGVALKARHRTAETNKALLCIAQPLLARLSLASILIILLASGRLYGGFAGSHLYSLANIVLQISLISFLILALPFRMSPGYRLMILLTDLPPNTLGKSVSKLYLSFTLLFRLIWHRDQEAVKELKASLSTRENIGFVLFALIFVSLAVAKLFVIVCFVIPRFASGLPAVLGPASQYIFAIILFALLWRFLRLKVLPKISKIKTKTSLYADHQTSNTDGSLVTGQSLTRPSSLWLKIRKKWLILFCAGILLIVPINRTVTGSVVVSNERDLNVRAPDDVRVVAMFQKGPSSQIITAGTSLAELQSTQLDQDLFQINSDLVELQQSLDSLNEDYRSTQKVLLEVKKSLDSYIKAGQILRDQLNRVQKLSESGAVSKQVVQELLLKSFELQENQRLKVQTRVELEADLEEAKIKIQAAEQTIEQSVQWQRTLLSKKKDLIVVMPFDGLITSTTSGLLGSFFAKGETILELSEGSLQNVNVLVPDHDRSLIKINQAAAVRLYANPNQSLSARVQSIRPSSELIDQKVYFEVSLRLEEPLSPNLLQSSGAARINSGSSNLFLLMLSSIGRFVRVDVWSWTP